MPLKLDSAKAVPLRRDAPALPANVGRLRRDLRRWLREVVDDPDTAEDLCLAVSEALENAVDHAFVGRDAGTVTLEAYQETTEPPSVVITVGDDGRWQPAADPGHRGRGLALIAGMCRSDLATGPAGTRVTLRRRC